MGFENQVEGILKGRVLDEYRNGIILEILVKEKIDPARTGEDLEDFLGARVLKFQRDGLPGGAGGQAACPGGALRFGNLDERILCPREARVKLKGLLKRFSGFFQPSGF